MNINNILDIIQFEDPNKNNGVIKASIHKTGKLGFSSGAQEFMGIDENTFYKIGFNNNDPIDTNIYIVPSQDQTNAFKAAKAGMYFYINLKHVFDKRGYEYNKGSNIFDIKKENSNGLDYYILSKRK
jgi:hypothetical protein